MTQTITRPDLTMPDEEAAALRAAYEGAGEILEYGSGGSTVMGAEMPGKRIVSVESDRAWAAMMRDWFAENCPQSQPEIVWANIGKTKEWGYPVDHSEYGKFPRYPLAVWQRAERPVAPDVVLVDGRFRIGCALVCAYLTTKPLTLFFDDYKPRDRYHKVETYIGAPQMIGRMAKFDLTPQPFPKEHWLQFTQFLFRP